MRALIWTTEARTDLDTIVGYIQERNDLAAQKMKLLIEGGADRAAQFPMAFRSGRLKGTREAVVHPNYILIFSVTDAEVVIASVLHARRRYPEDET